MRVLILRGISGAGKSSFFIQEPRTIIVSADDYHVSGGKYEYKKHNQKAAHDACLRRFLDILHNPENYELIVVDNTNISTWEIAPYYRLAELYGFSPRILTIHCDPKVAAERNIHSVPATVIFRMHQRLMEEVLPSHWDHEVVFV